MPAPLPHSTTENGHETLQDHKLNLNPELHRLPVHFGPDFHHEKQKYRPVSAFWQEGHRHAVPCPAHRVR
ncbi:Uncharacterised protein [Acinetobacter baumannii]|nr:Uncharacterised protein [Acinetobacter baumannii]SSS42146.1 Uncharacterised protein [Acinetobacter baumannii]